MTSLKVLIVPFSIMFLVISGIFWIYPGYVAVQEKTKIVEEKTLELQKSQGMVENGKALLENLRANKDKNDILLSVFPRQGSEEDALWFLSRLAQNSGISLTSVSVEKSQSATASDTSKQTLGDAMKASNATASPMNSTPNSSMNLGMNPGMSTPVQVVPDTLAVKYVSVTFDSVGTYESFQTFLSSIKGIPRVLREDTLKISVKKGEKEEATSFQMSGKISFAYAPLKRTDAGVISPVFELSVFDFSPVEKMREGVQSYAASQEVSTGRPNPFVP